MVERIFFEQENKLKKKEKKIECGKNLSSELNEILYTCFWERKWKLLQRAIRARSSAGVWIVGVDFLQLRSKVRVDFYTGLKYCVRSATTVCYCTIFLSSRSIPLFEMWWQSTSSSWRRFGQFSRERRDVSVKRGQLSRSMSSRLWRISPLHKWRIPLSVIASQCDSVNSEKHFNPCG